MGELTRVIAEGAAGGGAPVDALWSAAHTELKLLAHSRLYRDGQSTLLDTTSLVNESYVKLAGVKLLHIDDRRRFFAYASRVMSSVIVDLVRERMSQRRGGEVVHVALTATIADPAATDEPLHVHETLRELEAIEPRLGQVVEMRYFGGLSDTEIADILEVNVRTVGRDWDKARLLLREMLGRTSDARALLIKALDDYIAHSSRDGQPLLAVRERWGRFLLDQGDTTGATAQFDEIMQQAHERELSHIALAHGGLARVALRGRDVGTALAESAVALDLWEHREGFYDVRMGPTLQRIRADALAEAGRREEAQQLEDAAWSASQKFDAPESATRRRRLFTHPS